MAEPAPRSVGPESPPVCSDTKATGPSAIHRRQAGSSRKQIHARRRFTAVLHQLYLRTTVLVPNYIGLKRALISIKMRRQNETFPGIHGTTRRGFDFFTLIHCD